MKTTKVMGIVLGAALIVGCGENNEDNNTTDNNTAENNMMTGLDLSTQAKIEAFFEGKVLTMEGEDIPTEPNGFNENLDLGPNTQCYNQTLIEFVPSTFNLTTTTGVLENMMCNRMAVGTQLMFSTTSHAISNIQNNGECFDIDFTFNGFGQEGRASINAEGTEVKMELFFTGQATGHRCADGAVGASGVTLNMAEFAGDAVQVYKVTEAQ